MSDFEGALCPCCTFGDHTMGCVCPDAFEKDCCHPQNHFKRNPADRSVMQELAGPQELSVILGVGRSYALLLAKQPGFPKPVARLRCGAVYLVKEIEEYHRARQKKPGQRSMWNAE